MAVPVRPRPGEMPPDAPPIDPYPELPGEDDPLPPEVPDPRVAEPEPV